MFRKKRNLLGTGAVVLLLLFFPVFGGGAAFASGEDDYGPVPLGRMMIKSIEKYVMFQQNIDKNATYEMGRGYYIDMVFENRWMLTRAVMNGFAGAREGLDALRDERTIKAILLPLARSLKIRGKSDVLLDKARKERANMTVDQVSLDDPALLDSSQYKSHQKYIGILEDLEKGGFFSSGSGTIFNKMKFFGFFLLGVTFMASLAWKAYGMFTGGNYADGASWFKAFFKFMILTMSLQFLGKFMIFGISMSDAIRNIVLNSAFGGSSGMEVIGDLLDARMAMLNTQMTMSFMSVLGASAAKILAVVVGWTAYILAGASICVLIIISDVMMALAAVMGPAVLALSLLPNFDDAFGSWLRGYFTLLFYGPLAAVFLVLMVGILIIGVDTSPAAFIIICVAYIMGATQVPKFANGMTGMVLAGTAGMLAWYPTVLAKAAVGGTAGMAVKGVKSIAGSMFGNTQAGT